MKRCFEISVLIAGLLFFQTFISLAQEYNEYNEFPQIDNVSPYKAWTVKFNRPVYFHGLKQEDIYVQDESGAMVSGTVLTYEHSKPYVVVLNPPNSGWNSGKVYTLVVSSEIVSDDGMKLGRAARMKFTSGYQSGNISFSLERSNSLPVLYRASVGTTDPKATRYSIYMDGKSLAQAADIGQKSIFVLDLNGAAKKLEVRTFSSSGEADVLDHAFFDIK